MKNLLNNKRKTIGVLINEIGGWYGSEIIKGIRKIANERDINLRIFPGGSIKGKWRDEVQQNIIYGIVNKHKLDGLILTTGSLFNYITAEESTSFLEIFKDLPIVSIAVETPNSYNVLFDNKSSMYSVVSHLIEHHNYTRIAFISGLFSNYEAIERYNGYLSALQDHNIPFDRNYVVEGNFTEESGNKAVDTLFHQIKIDPQAIVASNDQMAIGAYHKLKEMGFQPGKNIALTGFDNSDEVKFFITPLTTVTQPTLLMGSLATELICDLLDGKKIDRCVNVKGELIIRESCSCLSMISNKTVMSNNVILNNDFDFNTAFEKFSSSVRLNKKNIINSIIKKFSISFSEDIEINKIFSNLLEDLIEDIKVKTIEGKFIINLNYLLNENVILKDQVLHWNDTFLSMRVLIIGYSTNYEILSLIEDIFYYACILTNTILLRFEAYNSYNFRMLSMENRFTNNDIYTAVCLEDLIKILKDYTLKTTIDKCYLCLYDNPTIYIPENIFPLPDKVKLFLCHHVKTEVPMEYFTTTEMLPDKYLYLEERNELLFQPLFIENLHFGFIVFSVNNIDEAIFETLREHISNSLNNQLLLNERKNAEEQLQIVVNQLKLYNHELHNLSVIDELTGLYNRRGFYIQGESYYKWASSNNESFILFYGDLDGLKKINDNFGHKYGDTALKATGILLKSIFKNSDILCRLGGDEYTALSTTNSSSDTLEIILERISSSFEKFNQSDSLPFKLSISIGYSLYDPNSHSSFDELIQEADSRLYEEKKRKKKINLSFPR